MAVHELAGKPAPESLLTNIPRLISAYYLKHPDPSNPCQQVSFGTSGHRGSSLTTSFNEAHIQAITQAICDFRKARGIQGPLYLGMDTHALSEPSHTTALEVLAANRIPVRYQQDLKYTPTPVISHAVLCHNRRRRDQQADGIVITPSHNPPEDGGFKYNPPHGGPAESDITQWIAGRANAILQEGNIAVKQLPFDRAVKVDHVQGCDFMTPYVTDLANVVRMDRIAAAGIRIGVDPMSGAAVHYWERIAEAYGLDLATVNPTVDPAFRFMTVDRDGKIRMDCSSPYAMARLIDLKDRFDIAFGNDPDVDRHGIVTPHSGLMNPNHYLAVAVNYLFQNRPEWGSGLRIGKTLVSSSLIDRIARHLDRELVEVPVGFKWFVEGLYSASLGFGGEESAGASFLRRDGTVWTTDKDGIIMNLLAAEMLAETGNDPGVLFDDLAERFGKPLYERLDAPVAPEEKARLKALTPQQVSARELAGDPIRQKLTHAPGNGAAIGGLKIVTDNGWFAARPSGTEAIFKIYSESFLGQAHLEQIQREAKSIVAEVLSAGGS